MRPARADPSPSSGSGATNVPPGAVPAPVGDASAADVARLTRLAFFELGEKDSLRLRALRDRIEPALDLIVADFYGHLLRFDFTETLLREEPGRVARLQGLQRGYVREWLDGEFGTAYTDKRLAVGQAHQHIGLEPEWYVGAFSRMLRVILRVLFPEDGPADPRIDAAETLIKIVFYDISLAIDSYIAGGFVEREVMARLEEAKRATDEALRDREETERLKDDLSRMIVHDLKNPVNGILMLVELALRRRRRGPPDAATEAEPMEADPEIATLERIRGTCGELLRLISNLLEIARMEEGRLQVVPETLELGPLLRAATEEYAAVAQEGSRQLVVAELAEPLHVIADRQLLVRVLANLVVNALRHSGGTQVELAAERDPVRGRVVVRVTDDGRGIAAEDRQRIFEKFGSVRVRVSEEPRADSGLGLAFCRLAVEQMGGHMAVGDAVGGGAVFSLDLPSASL